MGEEDNRKRDQGPSRILEGRLGADGAMAGFLERLVLIPAVRKDSTTGYKNVTFKRAIRSSKWR